MKFFRQIIYLCCVETLLITVWYAAAPPNECYFIHLDKVLCLCHLSVVVVVVNVCLSVCDI
jgi:hypothetical protein